MSTSFFLDLLGSIAERGRALVDRPTARPGEEGTAHPRAVKQTLETLERLARELISVRGEASGMAMARQMIEGYASLPTAARLDFFRLLARDFGPDHDALRQAWAGYDAAPSPSGLKKLLRAVEPPRQELFRRLNLTPGGTAALVAMREDLLRHGRQEAALACVDDDLVHLLYSWFNRGFLVLRPITWSTPADILERIIRYEAVHTIHGWDDLRRRLQPPDRRCFAFFHPSLVEEPLIFVQVALTRGITGSIQALLAEDREILPVQRATTAIFYSISNCQPGLRGVSFGSFLIKQVVEELSRELPSLTTFVTLSPAPGFAAWLARVADEPTVAGIDGLSAEALAFLRHPDWHRDPAIVERARPVMLRLAAAYYLRAKDAKGRPLDPVARFHLGNGARLEQLNWPADVSTKGLREGAGLMVNYLYDLRYIEANHEAYANQRSVAAASAVQRQLRKATRQSAQEADHV